MVHLYNGGFSLLVSRVFSSQRFVQELLFPKLLNAGSKLFHFSRAMKRAILVFLVALEDAILLLPAYVAEGIFGKGAFNVFHRGSVFLLRQLC